jgi:hypothetical protein
VGLPTVKRAAYALVGLGLVVYGTVVLLDVLKRMRVIGT